MVYVDRATMRIEACDILYGYENAKHVVEDCCVVGTTHENYYEASDVMVCNGATSSIVVFPFSREEFQRIQVVIQEGIVKGIGKHDPSFRDPQHLTYLQIRSTKNGLSLYEHSTMTGLFYLDFDSYKHPSAHRFVLEAVQ